MPVVDRRPCPYCGAVHWKYAMLREEHIKSCEMRPKETTMKTAKERAEEFLRDVNVDEAAWPLYLSLLEDEFKEHARDQRHLCAEAAQDADFDTEIVGYEVTCRILAEVGEVLDAVHVAVMSAKAPGEV